MSENNMQSRIIELRELRIAREKARLDKLREMNLKKYSRDENTSHKLPTSRSVTDTRRPSSIPLTKRPPSANSQNKLRTNMKLPATAKLVSEPKTSMLPGTSKPQASNVPDILSEVNKKTIPPQAGEKTVKTVRKTLILTEQIENMIHKNAQKVETSRKSIAPLAMSTKGVAKKPISQTEVHAKIRENKKSESRKSVAPLQMVKPQPRKTIVPSKMPAKDTKPLSRKTLAPIDVASKIPARKSLMPMGLLRPEPVKLTKTFNAPKVTQSASKVNSNRESVFDRLYKPKTATDKPFTVAQRLRTDPKFCDKVIKDANLLIKKQKRHTIFEQRRPNIAVPVRRSISAVHFKRIPRSELINCITKWSSSENVNKTPLKEINEDELVKHERIVSAVKSERKKVTFQRPSIHNGPTPAELQARLKNWLQKRGKSIDSYHHLQCFGLHHLVQTEREFKPYDDENKENVSVESDSDDGSYSEAMNDDTKVATNKWRRASCVTDFDETPVSMQSHEEAQDTNDLVNGALNDLTELLREGFDWEQAARWLRAIRERCPSAVDRAPYWECRAALEERQGNLPASVQCWEEAIAKGTERKVVEANLDQLLDKFMRLNISPKSEGARREAHNKMVDVRNVFKSTIIRFAVQQAKLRQSNQHDPTYTVTPVRRSGRLSHVATPRTPRGARTPLVQLCSSLRHLDEAIGAKAQFVPNATLPNTP